MICDPKSTLADKHRTSIHIPEQEGETEAKLLWMAAKMVQKAAYNRASRGKTSDAADLLEIAAQLERLSGDHL